MSNSTFRTNIFPASSARGFSIILLTVMGFLFLLPLLLADRDGASPFSTLLGLVILFGAFCLQASFENFAINTATQQYCRYNTILGFSFGQWQALPPVTGIVMKYFSELPISSRRGWQVENYIPYCIVMLSTQAANHQGIVVYKFPYSEKAQAAALAKELAKFFAVSAYLFDNHQHS